MKFAWTPSEDGANEALQTSANEKLQEHAHSICVRTDRMFAVLMVLQWAGGIAMALLVSPRTWIGAQGTIHPHVMMAVFGGAILASLPTLFAITRPGHFSTRMLVATSQVLFSCLLIHLSGGRIETHFHVFGSLAFLSAYRDWRVLVPATVIVAVDHLVRGIWWPESVFGVVTASNWRWLEHAAWVVFEDIFLLITMRQSVCEMRELAQHTAQLEVAVKVAEESEQRFRASFDQAAVGMCTVSMEGRILRMNDRYCAITGYGREELLQRRFQDITHPDDLEQNVSAYERVLENKDSQLDIEKRYIHKQGHDVWVQVTASTVYNRNGEPEYLIGIVQDISAAKAAKDQLLKTHEEIRKLSLVASKTRHSVIIADADGVAEWANAGFTELTGYEVAELIGRHPGRLLQGRGTDPNTVQNIRRRLRERKHVSTELVNYSKSGRPYWISLEIDPVFNEECELTNFIATQIDVTARKEREAELTKAMERAEAANQAKSQFMANMSHEMRTPLNGILGFTKLLLHDFENILPGDRNEYFKTIHHSGKHLLGLINDVLDLSKIEAGQFPVESIACSPHQVIAETVSTLRVRAIEKGIGLEYRWESPVPATIRADPHRLKQLLINLVGNAIKFTEQGSVLVVARLDQNGDQPALIVEVRDTGVGIPSDKLEAVFQPFVQADNSVTRRYGGTGLGLSISRRIAEALDGSLSVESQPGKGSTFTVRIATGSMDGVELHEQPPETVGADIRETKFEKNDLDGVRVLVVDDGDTNRRLIGLILERCGAKVRMAENGKIAFDMATETPFDVILMDMQMPVMDGYSATRRLRDRGCGCPIIALTAHAMKGDREKCEQAGCTGYLAKPVDIDELAQTVAASIGSRRNSQPAVETSQPSSPVIEPCQNPIRSLLPTEDEEIRAFVEEFLNKLPIQLEAMEKALAEEDLERLASLAHWLKGAGGTVGFDCFTQPAMQLEEETRRGAADQVAGVLAKLRNLGDRIVV